MIHFITCHFGIDDLIDTQLKYISKCTQNNYKVWMSYTTPTAAEAEIFAKHRHATWYEPGIIDNYDNIIANNKHKVHHLEYIPITPAPVSDRFYIHNFSNGRFIAGQNHQNNLHVLTDRVLQDVNTCDDDILIWLDNDTLPISNIDSLIKTDTLVAAQRSHKIHLKANNGSEAPSLLTHPLFTSCKVGFFKEHNLNWLGGREIVKTIPDIDQSLIYADTGGYMYAYLESNNISWDKLHVTRSLCEEDSRYWEIYGDIILHIGSVSLGTARQAVKKHVTTKDYYVKLYDDLSSGKLSIINENT